MLEFLSASFLIVKDLVRSMVSDALLTLLILPLFRQFHPKEIMVNFFLQKC